MPLANSLRPMESGTREALESGWPRPSNNREHQALPLFDHWEQVIKRIRSSKSWVLFLDFDGTLTPLRRHPRDVPPLRLPLRSLLRRLSQRPRLTLYIISGRRVADLRMLVQVPGVRLLGLHGWEGREVPRRNDKRKVLREAKALLKPHLTEASGVWLEDKGLGLAIHYRNAPESAVRQVRPVVQEVLKGFTPQLRLLEGKKIWELLPGEIDGKGPAVRRLLSKFPDSALPIFLGDDATDESAFAVLPRGLTIHVGTSRRTQARFRLRDPKQVELFLLKLEGEIA